MLDHDDELRIATAEEKAVVLNRLSKTQRRNMESLKELLVEELKDLYSAEKQMVKALPRIVREPPPSSLELPFKNISKSPKDR